MMAAAILVALYPPPIRERWGNDLAQEIAARGPRSWLNTVAGAVRLWAHPSDWPEKTPGQTRRILIVEITVVAMLVVLLLRAAGRPSATFTADLTHPAASTWLAMILAGLCLAAPLLPLRRRALWHLIATCMRAAAAPVAALLAMYTLAHSGLIDNPAGPLHALLRVYYWTSLTFIGYRLCTLASRISHLVIAPSPRRLYLATSLIGAGLALAATQNLTSGLRTATTPRAAALSAALAGIATITLATAHDLRRTR